MNRILLATCLLFVSTTAFAELENGDFSAGKNKWKGEGKVEPVEGAKALVVTLSKNNFSEATQDFKMPSSVKRIKVTLQVKAASEFVFNDKSRNISDVDFSPGGNYTWSALVHPRADFHIRLKDDGYNYKLTKVSKEEWTTVTAQIRGIKKPGNLELALVFPPGDGTMMVRGITVEELKE